jgi:hypothetical protein
MSWIIKATRRPRRVYDTADWVDDCRAVAHLLQFRLIWTKQQLDDRVEEFVHGVSGTIEDKIPNAKAHPNGKRLWTPSLTAL